MNICIYIYIWFLIISCAYDCQSQWLSFLSLSLLAFERLRCVHFLKRFFLRLLSCLDLLLLRVALDLRNITRLNRRWLIIAPNVQLNEWHRLILETDIYIQLVYSCVTRQTRLTCHTADMSAVRRAQQTCLLWHTADMSAVSHNRHVCCVTQQTCLLCDTHSRLVCCVT